MNGEPFTIPESNLSPQEWDYILLLRTVRQGVIRVSVTEGNPSHAVISYPDFLTRQEPGSFPLSDDERRILKLIKFVRYGTLEILVDQYGRYQIMGSSEQSYKLGKIDWQEWQQG